VNRTGLSEPMPVPGPGWADYGPWTRRVRVDLDQLRTYAWRWQPKPMPWRVHRRCGVNAARL